MVQNEEGKHAFLSYLNFMSIDSKTMTKIKRNKMFKGAVNPKGRPIYMYIQ